jgi:hypothetical protein
MKCQKKCKETQIKEIMIAMIMRTIIKRITVFWRWNEKEKE